MKSNKILTVILTTSMLLSACGNTNAPKTNPAPDDKAAKETVEPNKTETPTATEGENKDTLRTDSKSTSEDKTKTDDKTKEVATSSGEAEIVDGIPQLKISFDDALDKYFEHFGDDTIDITEVQLDYDNGKYKYEIEGYKDGTEYDIDIDAMSGEITETKEDNDEDSDTPIDIASIIKPEEAMKKALDGEDGAYIKEWSLEADGGKTVYDFDIEKGNDKKVDAMTGEVRDG